MSDKSCRDICCHGCPDLGRCSGDCGKCLARCPLSPQGVTGRSFADTYDRLYDSATQEKPSNVTRLEPNNPHHPARRFQKDVTDYEILPIP